LSFATGLIARSDVDCGGPSTAATPSPMTLLNWITLWLGSEPSSTISSSIFRPLIPFLPLTPSTIC